jgi:two-component system LytT family response regulator
MNPVCAIIVEDDPLMRRGLELKLRADPEIEVIACCGNGQSAVDQIREFRPDLVFLDVHMPQMDGFEVVEELEASERPQIIFISGHEEHALRAFDVSAVDYLLKPFTADRFATAVSRAKNAIRRVRAGFLVDQVEQLLEHAKELQLSAPTQSYREPVSASADQIVLKSGGVLHFTKVAEVIWIEAQGDFVKVQTGSTMQMVRETLQSLELKLDPSKFLRIHRSFLVNLDHVSRVKTALYGDYSVYMSDGTKLRLSRNYRGKLKALTNRALSWRATKEDNSFKKP